MFIPVESFYLKPMATGTLQQQVRQMITDGILSGRFCAGERLPSSRAMAAHLSISRITVTLAYTDLVSSDYLASKGRSGHFVSHSAPVNLDVITLKRQRLDGMNYDHLTERRYSQAPRIERPANWQDYPYAFIYGQPDATLFDHQNWRQCAVRALGKRDFDSLTSDYYQRDDPLLIEYILRNILPRRGIDVRADEVLLLLSRRQNGARRHGVVENPCYPGFRRILDQVDCRISAVDVDEFGLPSHHIPSDIDAVLTTVSHHCPTNATMPLLRRQGLLKAAREQKFVIIEDDYEFEMSFFKPASPSLKSLDSDGRVIYVGSFSKSLFPGLRMGYIVAPESFICEARALRATVLGHPPGHVQRTAAYFLSLGHYDTMINRMKSAYKRRRQVMDDAIAAEGLSMAGQGGFGGSSIWMRAPDGVDTAELAANLRKLGVLIEPGRVFFAPDTEGKPVPNNCYRLAYSSIAIGKIWQGITLIAQALRKVGPK
jgi:GntR family transcriptional regulator/MocR family aminotransferase